MNANFEKYAREQLGNQEVEVDVDALWANVAPHVKPANGSRKTLWYFLLGLAVGLTGFALFYVNNTSDNSIAVSNNTINSTNDKTTTIEVNTNAANATNVYNDTPQQLTTNQEEQANKLNATETTANAVEQQAGQSIKEKTTKEAKQNTAGSIASDDTNWSFQDAKPSDIGNNYTITNGTGINDSDVLNKTVAVADGALGVQGSAIPSNAISTPVNAFMAASKIPVLMPSHLNSEKELPDNFMDGFKMIGAKKVPAVTQKRRRGSFLRDLRYGIGIYGGLSSSASDLKAKDESAQEFVLLRATSEKQLETIHLGLNALIETEQGVYLRTGIEYSRIASLFSRTSSQVSTDTTEGVIEYQINSITGDTTEILGDVVKTITTQYNKKTYNYFHLIDVPFILGYNFGNYDDTWRIGVEAGVYANLFVKNKGEIPLADDTFYNLGDDNSKWYKTNIGISPYVGVSASYNVNQNIQVHFTPSFRFNSVFSTDANPIKEQHASLGVQAGIRFLFD